jgi:DNA-binding IclR family transcriptional regulator
MSSISSEKAPAYEVGVLTKALDIFDLLRNAPAGATLTEISAALKFPKATVFRILHTLEARAYVHRDGAGRFRLSAKERSPREESLLERLLAAGRPTMERLVELHRETVNMAVLDGSEIVVVYAIESPQAIRMSSKAGNRRHVHSSALGKALIAWRDPRDVESMLRVIGLPRFTPKTIANMEALNRELGRVRRLGYAEDNQENEMHGRCVAAPIRDSAGAVVAAVSVSGPVNRMTASTIKAILKDLEPAAEEIGGAL